MMKWICYTAFLLSPIALLPIEPEAELLALQRIADFWQDGELSIAKGQMIDFMEKFPHSTNCEMIAISLGDLALRENDPSSAIHWYSKIENPSFETLLKRFRCLYQMGWYPTLIDEITAYKNRSKEVAIRQEFTQLLALSLYQQCLNDSNKQQELALQAKPLFIELLETNQSEEMAHALAHIHTLLEDLEGATAVYETLAKAHPERDYLLQAALMESKFAPEKAIERFEQVIENGQKGVAEAAYWWIALSMKLGRHEDVVQKCDALLPLVDPRLQGSAFVLAGASYRHLKQHEKAAELFRQGLELGGEGEFRRVAMLALAEASYLGDDLPLLEKTIDQLKNTNPDDPSLPFWTVSKAQVLERLGQLEEALSTLAPLHTDIAESEKIRLEIKAGRPTIAREKALSLLTNPQGYRLLLQASEALAKDSSDGKKLFLEDLSRALEKGSPSVEEEKSWKFLAAITAYELNQLEQATDWIKPLANNSFPDAELLLALCQKDTPEFAPLAEKALLDGATLVKPALQHLTLFNAYREIDPPKAATHLYAALEEPIQEENLRWLAEFAEHEFDAERRERINQLLCNNKSIESKSEKPFLELAKAKVDLGKEEEALNLFEQLFAAYKTENSSWEHISESTWRFANLLKKRGDLTQAEQLLNELISSTCTRRDHSIALAALEVAKMKKDPLEAAPILRDLILQKHLPNEPVHLEAALETIELLGTDSEKKISLLLKMRKEFTEEKDLLSKEYHAARKALTEQNHIFESYLQFIDAELLLLDNEKESQTKGKQLLIQIRENLPPTPLLQRVESLLNRLDVHEHAAD